MKRALVSYLKYPTRLPADYAVQFSNPGIVIAIVRVLSEMGYKVDVIEYTDLEYRPDVHYDLFVCPRGVNWEYLSRNVIGDAVRVFFACTLYWKDHNRAEQARFEDLAVRRGVRLPPDRLLSSDEFALHDADGIICLGNEDAVKTFSDFPLVLPINNGVYPDPAVDLEHKDFTESRKRFLFYGSVGSVHKGMDLLLEAFLDLDEELYWVGQIEPHLLDVYKKELEARPNIHLVGWITLRSKQFYKLMRDCSCVILPSSAEGQVGGVVECMNQGLIPIVSRACVLDVDDAGIVLESCAIDDIRKTVKMVADQPASWHKRRAAKARELACTRHSAGSFAGTLRGHLEAVLAHAPRQREARKKAVPSVIADASEYLRTHWNNLGLILRGGEFMAGQGRWTEARTLLERALELEPECVTALSLMADLKLKTGNAAGAETCLLKAARYSPNDKTVLELLARTSGKEVGKGSEFRSSIIRSLIECGAYPRAIKELSSAETSGDADLEDVILLGEAQYLAGEKRKGVETIRRAAEMGSDARALRNLGWMLIDQGEYEAALSIYLKLGEAAPFDNEILVNKTYILQKMNKLRRES